MEESTANELRQPEGPVNPSGRKQRFSLSRLEILFGGLLLLGLIYIGYVLFFQGGADSYPALEKRMKKLEALIGEQAEKVDREIKAIYAQQAQLDGRLRALENASRITPPQSSVLPGLSQKTGPNTTAVAATEKPAPSPPTERKKILHKVKKGETLNSIAAKYKVSTKDLLAWNKKVKKKTVRPGDVLTILSR